MTAQARPRPQAFRLLLILALLAVIGRGVIAPGFMPVFSSGGIEMALCNGQGTIALNLGDHGDDGEGQPGDPCVFAAAVAAAPPQEAATIGVGVAAPVQVAALPEVVPGRGLAAPPPPARGPPRTA